MSQTDTRRGGPCVFCDEGGSGSGSCSSCETPLCQNLLEHQMWPDMTSWWVAEVAFGSCLFCVLSGPLEYSGDTTVEQKSKLLIHQLWASQFI